MVPPHTNFESNFLGNFFGKSDPFLSWKLAITPKFGRQSQKFEYSLNLICSKPKCKKLHFFAKNQGKNFNMLWENDLTDMIIVTTIPKSDIK